MTNDTEVFILSFKIYSTFISTGKYNICLWVLAWCWTGDKPLPEDNKIIIIACSGNGLSPVRHYIIVCNVKIIILRYSWIERRCGNEPWFVASFIETEMSLAAPEVVIWSLTVQPLTKIPQNDIFASVFWWDLLWEFEEKWYNSSGILESLW